MPHLSQVRRLVLVAVLAAWTMAPAAASDPPGEDLARGAVDPYESGAQRRAFLAIAGVDGELSETEFHEDASGAHKFARPFDRWAAMLRFDANANGTIDWIEANEYREDLRARMLGKFDEDRNRKLTGTERQRANEALARGEIPPPAVGTGRGQAGAPQSPAANNPNLSPQQKFVDRLMFSTDPDIDFTGFDMQKETLKAFDVNGNGQLDPEENQEYGRVIQQRMLEHFDSDGDGQIDALEEVAQMDRMMERGVLIAARQMERMADRPDLGEAQREMMRKSIDTMREHQQAAKRQRLRKYDADGDGSLSLPEAQAWRESRMQRGQRMQESLNKKFDLDGTGRMDSQEEFKAFTEFQRKAMQSQFQNFGLRPSPALLERFDEDRDGQIVGEEQEEMMTQLLIEALNAEQ